MTYDLAVWEGERPASYEAAVATFQDLSERFLEPETSAPPTPRIRSYVEALLDHWPDFDIDEDSPWADSPLMDNAVGPIFYFAMVPSKADEASAFAAELARSHGLVCFDPQWDSLRP
jgi:hypothetical protein